MYIRNDIHSDRLIQDMLAFGMTMFNASYGLFYWYGSDLEIMDPQTRGMPGGLMDQYNRDIRPEDPLNTRDMALTGKRVAMLRDYNDQLLAHSSRDYLDYLDFYNIGDEVDLVFWRKDQPFAGMAMLRQKKQPYFYSDHCNWEVVRTHFQSNLQSHWRVRSNNIEYNLTSRFNIKPSELKVIEYLLSGTSNGDIAAALGISVATVKTHIVSILNKLGVDNRASIVAFIHDLQFS